MIAEVAQPTATAEPTPTEVPQTPNPEFVSALLGLWQGNNGSFYLFRRDGTWSWDGQRDRIETTPEKKGIWWIEGTALNLVDSEGQPPCPKAQVGIYQMDFRNGVLLLGQLQDRCRARSGQTQGMYHAVK